MLIVFFVITSNNEYDKNMEQRTNEEWRNLRDNAILAILMGRSANEFYGEMSIHSLVDDVIMGSDYLVEELKRREETEL